MGIVALFFHPSGTFSVLNILFEEMFQFVAKLVSRLNLKVFRLLLLLPGSWSRIILIINSTLSLDRIHHYEYSSRSLPTFLYYERNCYFSIYYTKWFQNDIQGFIQKNIPLYQDYRHHRFTKNFHIQFQMFRKREIRLVMKKNCRMKHLHVIQPEPALICQTVGNRVCYTKLKIMRR